MLLDKEEIHENNEASPDESVHWPDCSKDLLFVNPADYEKKCITEWIHLTFRRLKKIKRKTPNETKNSTS
jgi:hypothetical protein